MEEVEKETDVKLEMEKEINKKVEKKGRQLLS